MSAILYPIAGNAEEALNAPSGRAPRERDAGRLAGAPVRFVREYVGPVFRSEAEARAAWRGRLDEPGSSLPPEDRFCDLKPLVQRSRVPFAHAHTVWRLSVAYWRTGLAHAPSPEAERPAPQARKARRHKGGPAPDAPTLDALANQPLQPIKPQKALDIGLFEVRLPEAPHIVVPDE